MTDTPNQPSQPEPALRDLVKTPYVIHEHQAQTGYVVDIFRLPYGARYRVRYRHGITEWHFRDELIIQPFTEQRASVLADLAAARTLLHHAITTAEPHDPLHQALGGLLDTLKTTTVTYFDVDLADTPGSNPAPAIS